MTLRTGKLDVLAAELVGPGEEGWEDVLDVLTAALRDDRAGGYPSGVLDAFSKAIVPYVCSGWLVHEPGHGVSVWRPEAVAKRLPETRQPYTPPLRCYVGGESVSGEDAPGVVRVDESVSTGSEAPTDWNLYANGEYVGTAPVKKPKPPKRCMWVWHDVEGWHQCDHQRAKFYSHSHPYGSWVSPRDSLGRRCLGADLVQSEQEKPRVRQCDRARGACGLLDHDFYVTIRLEENVPVKSPPWFPRCLWVWHDIEGWHQCAQPRSGHDHDEVPGRYVGFDTSDEPRCLGVWTVERQPGEVEVVQCPLLASDCEAYHPFYARRTFKEET